MIIQTGPRVPNVVAEDLKSACAVVPTHHQLTGEKNALDQKSRQRVATMHHAQVCLIILKVFDRPWMESQLMYSPPPSGFCYPATGSFKLSKMYIITSKVCARLAHLVRICDSSVIRRPLVQSPPGRELNFGRPSFVTPSVDRDVKPLV